MSYAAGDISQTPADRSVRDSSTRIFAWTVFIVCPAVLVIFWVLYSRNSSDFWAWLVSVPVYFAGGSLAGFQFSFKRADPALWMGVVGFLALVVNPLMLLIFGAVTTTYPQFPSWNQINHAQLLTVAAYVAICVGYVVFKGSERWAVRSKHKNELLTGSERRAQPGPGIALVLIAIGYSSAGAAVFGSVQKGSPFGLLAPMALLGGLYILQATGFPRRWRSLAVLSVCLVPLIVVSDIRGTAVFSSLALLATYSVRIRPLSGVRVMTFVAVFGYPIWVLWGYARKAAELQTYGVVLGRENLWSLASQVELWAAYAAPAPHVAFALQAAPAHHTLVPSILAPVPLLGEYFRDSTGSVVFNQAIYGGGVIDQIVPATAEAFWNGGAPLVLLLFAVVGACLGALKQRYLGNISLVGTYFSHLTGLVMSLSLLWGIGVVSQYMIYSVALPLIVHLALVWFSTNRVGPSPSGMGHRYHVPTGRPAAGRA